jgi:integrase
MLKDKWDGREDLGLRVSKHTCHHAIYFDQIRPDWFKDTVKRYILYSRGQAKEFRTLSDYVCVLRKFGNFLEAKYINSFQEINEEILAAYLDSLKSLSSHTKQTNLSKLKVFFETGSANGWFNVSTFWFKGKIKSFKSNYRQIQYIPDEVLSQLDEQLHLLPAPMQRMVILFRTLGLRSCELLQMQFDCLRQRRDRQWELHFINWKFQERQDILPIIPEIAEIIRQQQAYIRKNLKEGFKYLFCSHWKRDRNFKFTPEPRVMSLYKFNDWLNRLAERGNICDESSKRWHFSSHQFRRTVATKMTNAGVRQYIIQRYLRHDSPEMMQHYAQLFSTTAKKEIEALHKQKRIIDVTGKEVKQIHSELDNDVGLQWLRQKMQPLALAMGFCARLQLIGLKKLIEI